LRFRLLRGRPWRRFSGVALYFGEERLSLAQAHLQAALAKHWAYRDLSRYDELQRAFGQRITAVVPISTGKKMRVGFTLEDGAQLVFDASDTPLPPSSPPARRPRQSGS